MKRIFRILKIVVVLVLVNLTVSPSSAVSQNLLSNGSFENGAMGWTPGQAQSGVVTAIDNSVFFEGSASARVEISSSSGRILAGWFQKVTLEPGKRYLFEYAVKTDVQSDEAIPYFSFANAADSEIYLDGMMFSSGVQDWTTYQYRFIAPSLYPSMTVVLALFGDTATCWFDALQLTEVTDTSFRNYLVDMSESAGQIEPDISVNAGPFPSDSFHNVDLSPEFRRLGVKYVRTHDYGGAGDINVVFPDRSADPLNPVSYDFARSDTAIRAIIDAGSEVFFRIGTSAHFPYIRPSSPDVAKWAQVVLQIVKHYNEGWNNGFYFNIRYWEFWNEPTVPIFWQGTAEEYAHLYQLTANLIKTHDPQLQVGGPVLGDFFNRNFLKTFFDTLAATGAPLDFYSYHNYVSSNPMFLVKSNAAVRARLASYGYGSIPTFISEWSNCITDDQYQAISGCDDPMGGAQTESSLIYMQQAGIAGEIFYRADNYPFGLYDSTGTSTFSGLAFEAFSELRQTPNGVVTSGADSLGTALIAGYNDYGTKITAIVSDNSSNANGYRLHIKGLGQTPKLRSLSRRADAVLVYHYEITRIDSTHALTLFDSGNVRSDNPVISVSARSPFVDKLTFELIDTIFAKGSGTPPAMNLRVYPNPFNSVASISFETSIGADVRLDVYNLLGQRVSTLVDEEMIAGPHSVGWDAGAFASGVYFIKITTPDNSVTRQIVLLK